MHIHGRNRACASYCACIFLHDMTPHAPGLKCLQSLNTRVAHTTKTLDIMRIYDKFDTINSVTQHGVPLDAIRFTASDINIISNDCLRNRRMLQRWESDFTVLFRFACMNAYKCML
jgi:hypothetical protein